MKQWINFICVLCIIVHTVLFSACVSKDKASYFSGKSYNSVEELHEDLVQYLNEENDQFGWFIRPVDIIYTLEMNTNIIVICTYYDMEKETILDDFWFAYYVKYENNYYTYAATTWDTAVEIPIFSNSQGYINNVVSAINIEVNGKKQSVCMLSKPSDIVQDVYIDGNKTTEIRLLNPISEQEEILCYTISDKPEVFYLPTNKQHNVELH